MRTRRHGRRTPPRLAALAAACLAANALPAQDASPPLLPVPVQGTPAPHAAPITAPLEYDRSLMYLPERAPPARETRFTPPAEQPAPRGWLTPSLWLAGTLDGPAPSTMSGGKVGTALGTSDRAGVTADAGLWLEPNRDLAVAAGVQFLGAGRGSLAGYGVAGGNSTRAAAEWETRYVSADAGGRCRLWRAPRGAAGGELQVTGLAGYRFAYLGEDFAVRGFGPLRSAETTNLFHAPELGLAGSWRSERWSLDVTGRVALGVVVPSGSLAGAGGEVPAVSTQPQLGTMPSVAASLGRRVAENAVITVGYNLQTLNGVTRPGAAFDGEGPGDFWAQGASLGLRWEY